MYGLSSISAAGLRPAADNYHCLCKRKWFINQNLTHAEQQLLHGVVDRTVDLRPEGRGFEPTLGRLFLYVSFSHLLFLSQGQLHQYKNLLFFATQKIINFCTRSLCWWILACSCYRSITFILAISR